MTLIKREINNLETILICDRCGKDLSTNALRDYDGFPLTWAKWLYFKKKTGLQIFETHNFMDSTNETLLTIKESFTKEHAFSLCDECKDLVIRFIVGEDA